MSDINSYQVMGENDEALFTLKLHRGEGMCLLAMDWKNGNPPNDFVGFGIQYKEPGGNKFYPIENRLYFKENKNSLFKKSTLNSPIQKFRWVHFPRFADLPGAFTYEVIPVFMNADKKLTYGESQMAKIVLNRETYKDLLNVSFTRGFISSQAFVERYTNKETKEGVRQLLPAKADDGPTFVPTHSKKDEALRWMGFEARAVIFEMLNKAIADDDAKVYVVAYDLSQADIIKKFKQLKKKLQIIIDDSSSHKKEGSAENYAETALKKTAGAANVKRQNMSGLQHNKMIIVDSPTYKAVVFGSTNFLGEGFMCKQIMQ